MNRYLTQYVEQKNFWRTHFGKPAIDPANISPREARELLDALDNELSPENLCCDGELRGAALQAKKLRLTEAKKALKTGMY